VRELLDRAQILVSLFIEGGTPLELDDQDWTVARWRVYFLYERLAKPPTPQASVYSIVGYATTYRFLTFTPSENIRGKKSSTIKFPPSEDLDVSSLPCRGRISQFLILPPHHHSGHGSKLYATIFKHCLEDPNCIEITIEDPSEAFDDLRDYCDFTRLLQNGTLEKIFLRTDVDPKLFMHASGRRLPTTKLIDRSLLTSIRRENKIAARQFSRLVELWLLSKIPSHSRQAGTARLTRRAKSSDEGDRMLYFWRLLVKQRIYNMNRDKFFEVEKEEVAEHLEQTVNNQLEDYERLLGGLGEKAIAGGPVGAEEPTSGKSRRRGKRNLVEEDDDDDRGKRQKSVLPDTS